MWILALGYLASINRMPWPASQDPVQAALNLTALPAVRSCHINASVSYKQTYLKAEHGAIMTGMRQRHQESGLVTAAARTLLAMPLHALAYEPCDVLVSDLLWLLGLTLWHVWRGFGVAVANGVAAACASIMQGVAMAACRQDNKGVLCKKHGSLDMGVTTHCMLYKGLQIACRDSRASIF